MNLNLSSIIAISRSNASKSWLPVMTNAQLTSVFGQKPDRQMIINRMRNRRYKNLSSVFVPQ